MPIGSKGFQTGNIWRFQPYNKLGKGGIRTGAGRPRYYTQEDELFIRRCPLSLRKKTFWYIRQWLSHPEYLNETNSEELRIHKILIRIFRRSYGGAHLARVKRFYANVQKRRLKR